ncbi:MAG: hypothetical protein AAF530_09880 [Pseudomonadota bacterium]
MYRSVQQSEQQGSGARKIVHWLEGIAIGVVVVIGFIYVFGLLLF